MKKLFVFFAFLCSTSASISAGVVASPVNIFFTVEIFGKGGTANPLPKSPIRIPMAILEGNVLSFESFHPDGSLILLDEEGHVMYQTMVSASANTVVLPDSLSGCYEMQLLPEESSYYFCCFINL